MEDTQPPVAGTQSVRRALMLLRIVANHREEGVRLPRIVELSGLERVTAYRLLTCLTEERFLERDPVTRAYRVGLEAALLAPGPQGTPPLPESFPLAMRRVARICNEPVFCMVREGDYVCCAHREVATSRTRVDATPVGVRRLLGTGTGGTAMLALLEDQEIERIYGRHESEFRERGRTLADLHRDAEATRQRQYAVTREMFQSGIGGVGVAFKLSDHAMAAFSVATMVAKLGTEVQRSLAGQLLHEVRTLRLQPFEAPGVEA